MYSGGFPEPAEYATGRQGVETAGKRKGQREIQGGNKTERYRFPNPQFCEPLLVSQYRGKFGYKMILNKPQCIFSPEFLN